MRGLTHNLSFRTFFTIGPYEDNHAFQELLGSLAKRGLLFAGILGIIIVTIFVFSHTVFLNKTIVWYYSGSKAVDKIMFIDKLVLVSISLFLILLSKSSITLFWSRLVLSVIVWFATLIILIEDIASNDTSFSAAYIIVGLIIAIGTIPFKGWQILSLCLLVILTTIITIRTARFWFSMAAVEPEPHQVVYLYIVTLLLTGLSSHIYLNRYDQFLAQMKAKELSDKLKERSEVLQKMKMKSDNQAAELRKNEELKNSFFTNISHELRTPLTLIMGPLKDYLKSSSSNFNEVFQPEVIELMYKNTDRLHNLINQLLDLSKIEAGEIKLNPEEIDLADWIPEVVEVFKPAAKAKNLTITCIIQGKNLDIQIDSEQLQRVISNLLSNAIKFTPQGGSISVSVLRTKELDREYQIRISDTGLGISEDDLPNIFDRYYQVSGEQNSINPGTGIGLSLVREIIRLHEGEIKVESEKGKGTTFTINLYKNPEIESSLDDSPALSITDSEWILPEESNDEVFEEYEPESIKSRPLLLLIDDNLDVLKYLRMHLEKRYQVIAQTASNEALKVLEREPVDLVISDVMMPAPDGFELCDIIKKHPDWSEIPVILLTARADQESKIEGLEQGADDYLNKPFSATELMIRIENLIEIRRFLRNKYRKEIRLKGSEIEVTSEDARFLEGVQEVVENHMHHSNFGVDWLASEVNLSARQLQRKIKATTNLSAGGYIRMLRLERARQLLSQEWGNISEISDKVGFQNRKYFSRLFKQTFDETPTDFIQNNHSDQ
ncbi:response regulator [Balneolaceae bacterium YR4-1]|uniref:histidine kinase n=1 Tax=Halalkalibaculum roseum TaxID=2709311 RepID=A0A6M1T0R7_9BACT|nr:ATP-binding protein [Halalkalibaculum roseum]NGP77104.1 response regulator [Halalkalibaculum roseum]